MSPEKNQPPSGERPHRNRMAVASFVLGVVALVFEFMLFTPQDWDDLPAFWWPEWIAASMGGVLAVIFGAASLIRQGDDRLVLQPPRPHRWMAVAGVVVGVLAIFGAFALLGAESTPRD